MRASDAATPQRKQRSSCVRLLESQTNMHELDTCIIGIVSTLAISYPQLHAVHSGVYFIVSSLTIVYAYITSQFWRLLVVVSMGDSKGLRYSMVQTHMRCDMLIRSDASPIDASECNNYCKWNLQCFDSCVIAFADQSQPVLLGAFVNTLIMISGASAHAYSHSYGAHGLYVGSSVFHAFDCCRCESCLQTS